MCHTRRLVTGFVLATVAISTAAHAQSALAGVLGGVNVSTFGGNDARAAKERTGLVGGAFLSIESNPRFAIETGAFYSQRGGELPGGSAGGTFRFRVDYVEIPVLAVFRSPIRTKVDPFFGIGGAVGIRVGCQLSTTSANSSLASDCSLLAGGSTSAFNSNDLGAVGELGVDTRGVRFVLRFNLGLTSVDASGSGASIQNRTLSLLVGYGFRIGGD